MPRAAVRKESRRQLANDIDDVLAQNIKALLEVRQQFDKDRTPQDVVADAITSFTGSLPFAYVQGAFVIGWILLNSGALPHVRPFDPFPLRHRY